MRCKSGNVIWKARQGVFVQQIIVFSSPPQETIEKVVVHLLCCPSVSRYKCHLQVSIRG